MTSFSYGQYSFSWEIPYQLAYTVCTIQPTMIMVCIIYQNAYLVESSHMRANLQSNQKETIYLHHTLAHSELEKRDLSLFRNEFDTFNNI